MMRLRVKEVAAEKGFTMGRLRREAQISHNTLRTMYRDPYRHVNSATLDKIAHALGVDVSELVESVPDNEHEELPDDVKEDGSNNEASGRDDER